MSLIAYCEHRHIIQLVHNQLVDDERWSVSYDHMHARRQLASNTTEVQSGRCTRVQALASAYAPNVQQAPTAQQSSSYMQLCAGSVSVLLQLLSVLNPTPVLQDSSCWHAAVKVHLAGSR